MTRLLPCITSYKKSYICVQGFSEPIENRKCYSLLMCRVFSPTSLLSKRLYIMCRKRNAADSLPVFVDPWIAATTCVPFCVMAFTGSWCCPSGACCTIVTVCMGVAAEVWRIRVAAPIEAVVMAGRGSTFTVGGEGREIDSIVYSLVPKL